MSQSVVFASDICLFNSFRINQNGFSLECFGVIQTFFGIIYFQRSIGEYSSSVNIGLLRKANILCFQPMSAAIFSIGTAIGRFNVS